MADYTWALVGCATRAFGGRELAHAQGRAFTLRLDAASSATFTLDGRHSEAEEIVALATDLLIYRDGELIFRGRIAPEVDDISESSHTAQFTAIDYRGLLGYRITGTAGATYTSTASGVIVADLVADTQATTGGDLDIVPGVGTASGTVRDLTVLPGKPVMETINELARLDGGFEWEISPTLTLDLYHSGMGADNGVVLDYGGLLSRVSRQLAPDEFANAVLVTGNQDLTPVMSTSGTIGSDERGRWELSQGFPTIEVQATLNAKGPWLLAQTSTLRPTYRVSLRPDTPTEQRWRGPDHMWKGDTVYLAINSGRLLVDKEPHRIVEITVAVDENGSEDVQLGLLAA